MIVDYWTDGLDGVDEFRILNGSYPVDFEELKQKP